MTGSDDCLPIDLKKLKKKLNIKDDDFCKIDGHFVLCTCYAPGSKRLKNKMGHQHNYEYDSAASCPELDVYTCTDKDNKCTERRIEEINDTPAGG